MRKPTAEEVATVKAECRKRFGHERVIGIPLVAPIDAYVILAAMTLADAGAYSDARLVSAVNAASALVADRALWPEDLEALRARWGAIDLEIDKGVRQAHGFEDGAAAAVRLTRATVPPGLAAADVAALEAANKGCELWSMTRRENGLALVVRAPLPDVVAALGQAASDAARSKTGAITWALPEARALVAWAPGVPAGADARAALDKHLEEMPGRADDIGGALLAMGGAGTVRRAEFL